jgi:hypothetical protein
MKELKQYILETLGEDIEPDPIPKPLLGTLPMYVGEKYKLYNAVLLNRPLLFAEARQLENLSILQTEKHFNLLKNTFARKVVLIMPQIEGFNRKRLIERGINFIVPGKQLYLPDLLIDLRETFTTQRIRRKNNTLLPSAQFLLIYHIIHRYEDWKLEKHSFKEIAEKTGYTAMAITKAVDNLKHHELVNVAGDKEKFIHFLHERHELWYVAEQRGLLINPVLKRVYVDEKPQNKFMLECNTSALSEYSDINPSRQQFYAIEKNKFYDLQKNNALTNANEYEGRYCLEVWKYDPETLVGELANDRPVVDPLSLYLSLKDSHDERIEMALEQIKDKNIW